MSLNMKTLTQALAKTAAVIEKTVSTTVQEVTGPRPLQDYDLLDQVGSGGPGLAWRLYSARPRASAPSTQYPLVCVWVLDKRSLSEARTRAGLSKAAEDAFFEITRADAARLVRLRHPGVVHVVQGLDESKNAMAMVTEPLFASVANAIGDTNNIAKVPKELKGMEIGLLEVKHGLLQVAECLDFLHNNARLVHRSISPETVYITSSGAWKLGGFGFAVSIDQISSDSNSLQPFHYPEYDVEDSVLPLQPSLNYTAPELVHSRSSSRGFSSDIFSFGCLAYHLVARKPLLDCHNNVKMYTNSLTYLSSEAFSAIPPDLIPDLRRMLSMDESSRPSASDFTGSSFFRDDTRLRALRFLDHMLERDNMQKTEFLKALSDMWKDFDSRILRYKVLPPLCAELRNVVMQPMILPMVLTIAESQDKVDFELSTLPVLVPVLSSASGETLLLLVKHSELIINKASHDHLLSNVLPLLVRAYDDTDPRIQEEVLRRTVALAKKLDTHLVKQAVLPRVHSLALRTTVAAVRVNALRCLGDMVQSLDKHAVEDILQTLQRCTAVDRSAPTLMCTLAVSNSILKQHGIEFAAEHVVPLLFPLLTAQQLNIQQFAKYMLFIKDILRKIEEKRGIAITDTGNSEFRVTSPVPNGVQSEPVQKSTSSIKKSYSWDEDWGPVKKESVSSTTTPNVPSQLPSQILQTTPISAVPLQPSVSSAIPLQSSVSSAIPIQSSVSTSNQQPISSTTSEIEWPPRNLSTGRGFSVGSTEKVDQSTGSPSDAAFEDIDPFANWPPKPSGSGSSAGFGMMPTPSHSSALTTAMNPGLGKDPTGLSNQHHSMVADAGKLNGIGFKSQNSTGLHFHGNSLSSTGASYSTPGGAASANFRNPSMNATPGKGDIGSIFGASNNGQAPLKLAPPPPKAIGRGRGRGQGNARPSSSSGKIATEKPPLLDLL